MHYTRVIVQTRCIHSEVEVQLFTIYIRWVDLSYTSWYCHSPRSPCPRPGLGIRGHKPINHLHELTYVYNLNSVGDFGLYSRRHREKRKPFLKAYHIQLYRKHVARRIVLEGQNLPVPSLWEVKKLFDYLNVQVKVLFGGTKPRTIFIWGHCPLLAPTVMYLPWCRVLIIWQNSFSVYILAQIPNIH